MWESYQNPYGLLNQITAANTANVFSTGYGYIRPKSFLSSIKYTDSFIPKNYKLLKRNRYLKLI